MFLQLALEEGSSLGFPVRLPPATVPRGPWEEKLQSKPNTDLEVITVFKNEDEEDEEDEDEANWLE